MDTGGKRRANTFRSTICDVQRGVRSARLTQEKANTKTVRVKTGETRRASYGPWLVGLGAALWGTESAWRIPLNDLFEAQVIVFWEHVLILLLFLPILLPQLTGLRKIDARTWGYLLFSGFAGSAVGTVFFTLA